MGKIELRNVARMTRSACYEFRKRQKAEEQAEMKLYRLIIFPAIWLALFYGPMYAGDWWDGPLFNFWQSIPSLLLVIAVLPFKRERWAKCFIAVLTLVCTFNVLDAAADFSSPAYNNTMSAFNALEALCWFVGSGLYDWLVKKAGNLVSGFRQRDRKHEPAWIARRTDNPSNHS